MSPRRVAIIGCGDISSVHAAALSHTDRAELVAVCDTDAGRLATARDAYGVPGYADHTALLANEQLDAVHVCTPHDAHAPIAIEALDAGVNVLLEKPLAHSLQAAEQISEAAERSSATLGICFQNRYNTPVRRLHDLLATGELGEVQGVSATVMWSRTADYFADRPWRGHRDAGGGLLMNQAIHTVDLLLWLLGEAETVRGAATNRVLGDAIEVEDTADLVIDHVGGVRSVLFATLANGVNEPVSVDVTTSEARLTLRDSLTVRRSDGRVEVVEQQLATGERAYWGVSHEVLVDDFYASLDAGKPFWLDAREGTRALEVVQEIYRQSGRPSPVA
jgi:predicted dehydrogenase